ncbi:hypothetical protein G6F43_002237 [Rhizopus delemar]|nr:hypothetical protein G6F43_002237 [Rhizopus delemar]
MATYSLNCFACQNKLASPITLSCGYTVCQSCLPPTEDEVNCFVCPVSDCKREKHLFGPSVNEDQVIESLLVQEGVRNSMMCSIGQRHLLDHPVTNHCGHTFCKLCLLQQKIMTNSCPICQKRLPSYQFIQAQPVTFLINRVLLERYPADQSQKSWLPPSTSPSGTEIPINLLDFPLLPSQILRIPMRTLQNQVILRNHFLVCPETQSLQLAVLYKFKASVGTIAKITSVEQRENGTLITIVGMDRFAVLKIKQTTEDHVVAEIERKFEQTESEHTTDDLSSVKLATRIHSFFIHLAQSAPSRSFSNHVQGLLGPVWLDSVQTMYGPLPSPEDPVGLCWWSAAVLPVGNHERHVLLETNGLMDRLGLILLWIQDLESQWTGRREAEESE